MGFLLIAYCMVPIQHISCWIACGTSESWSRNEAVSMKVDPDGMRLSYSGSWTFGMEDIRS